MHCRISIKINKIRVNNSHCSIEQASADDYEILILK